MGVNGRQKWFLVDTVDKSMILMIANIHDGFREIIAFSRLVKNPPARTGSQEVTSSILVSSTNKINRLRKYLDQNYISFYENGSKLVPLKPLYASVPKERNIGCLSAVNSRKQLPHKPPIWTCKLRAIRPCPFNEICAI